MNARSASDRQNGDFPLTRLERQRILDGNPLPLVRDRKPEFALGDTVVVALSRAHRHADQLTGHVIEVPRHPTVWITVTRVTARRKGGWAVRYDITDVRDTALFLAPGTGFTSDPSKAADPVEAALTDKDRNRLALDARASHAERQERDREGRLRQERALRARLREALDGLPPVGQQQLLAAVERELARWAADGNGEQAA